MMVPTFLAKVDKLVAAIEAHREAVRELRLAVLRVQSEVSESPGLLECARFLGEAESALDCAGSELYDVPDRGVK